jgi:tetratricopeptide (TPR) repeat protein
VAWVTERKDVLSVFFSLVSLAVFARFAAAYREHLERPTGERTGVRAVRWYLLLAAGYGLCLMSKPMTLPLPLLMLLVAAWPIPRERRPGLLRLAIALAPLLVLSAGAIFLYSNVDIAHAELEQVGLQSPFSVAEVIVTSLAAYPARLLFPANLQHIYAVHPGSAPAWQVAGSLLLLAAATTVSAACARRRPFLVVGWLWYLVSLLPVVVLFLSNAAADRFSYFPVIGITVMVVWSVGELADRRWPASWAIATTAAVIALALTTRAECRHWQNSLTLFSHLLELDPRNDLARRQLGIAQGAAGEPAKALESLRAVLASRPDVSLNHYNMGVVLEQLGRADEALGYYAEAARLAPNGIRALYNSGLIHLDRGNFDDGLASFLEAIRRSPRSAGSLHKVGSIKALQGQFGSAAEFYRRALEIDPGNPLFMDDLRLALAALENPRDLSGGD